MGQWLCIDRFKFPALLVQIEQVPPQLQKEKKEKKRNKKLSYEQVWHMQRHNRAQTQDQMTDEDAAICIR